MTIKEPFKLIAIGSLWFWLIAFALLPNLLVIIASVLERGADEFVVFAFTRMAREAPSFRAGRDSTPSEGRSAFGLN